MASSINASTLRLTGMSSGMDTESIVDGLLTASKTKLQAAEKQKISLEWKQEAYKSILTKLNSFQTKYFGTSSTSSVGSTILGSSLTKLSASYSSSYVSVATTSDSASGSIYVADIVSLASAAKLSGSTGVSGTPTISVDTENLADLAGKSIDVTLNGVKKSITFSDKTYTSAQDVRDELTSQLQTAFGSGKITVAGSGDDITLTSSNSTLQLSVPSDSTKDPSSVLDFGSYASNRLSLTASLSSAGFSTDVLGEDDALAFSINGVSFSFSSTKSMSDIMKSVNASNAGVKMAYSSLTDSFSLTSNTTGAQSAISFEDSTGSLMSTLFGGGSLTAGTDAVVKLSTNGSTDEADMITLTRSTNTISVDGTQITLLGKASGDAEEGVNINLSYDTDAIATKITDFVTDYNALLKTLTDKLSEDVYKDYTPLTDDEKDELTDSEIELWEEKAKSGLLKGDSTLSSIVSELRTSMNSVVQSLTGDGNSSLLSAMGITTGTYSEKGQIHINTEELKKALENDAEKVLGAFTQKSDVSYSAYATTEQKSERFRESGVLWRISDVLANNLATVGKKGTLITLVGSPNSTNNANSEYSKRITSMEDKIETMKDKLVDEEDRYWERFTAMESALSKLQSQNSWLTSMLGGST
jgi:flagellar hook-associated protein 2